LLPKNPKTPLIGLNINYLKLFDQRMNNDKSKSPCEKKKFASDEEFDYEIQNLKSSDSEKK